MPVIVAITALFIHGTVTDGDQLGVVCGAGHAPDTVHLNRLGSLPGANAYGPSLVRGERGRISRENEVTWKRLLYPGML